MNTTEQALNKAREALEFYANTTEWDYANNQSQWQLLFNSAACDGHGWETALRALIAVKEALAQPAQEPEQAPDTSQDWAKLDGATAFHLIERHADDWNDARNMMEAWAKARYPQPSAPVAQEGWKLVPHEPTKEMLEAGFEQWHRLGATTDAWQAMWHAAPSSQKEGEQ